MKRYYVNAFAKTKDGGNPAGVVLDADLLSEKDMLDIAFEIGFSETAFVSKSEAADYKVRFFTPVEEVDLCGHGTIATFSLLKYLNLVDNGEYTQETKAGVLLVKVNDDSVFMEQPRPKIYEIISKDEIAKSLGINKSSIISDVQVYSTGLKDIIIHLDSLDTINNLNLDFDLISEISKKYDSIGYHVFTLETLNNNTAHCRNFAPIVSINEESATGTASGALASYLVNQALIKVSSGDNTFVFEQGYTMDKPSEITAVINVSSEKIEKVLIGGKSIIIESKSRSVPLILSI